MKETQSNNTEYVTSSVGMRILGVERGTFFYHVDKKDIEVEPGGTKRKNRYKLADILKLKEDRRMARIERAKKKLAPPALIDWMYERDLPAGVKLAQSRYDESVDLAEMAVYQSWRKNNQHLTLAAFSTDRSEAYASIQVVPLPERIILDVLAGRRTENSIQADEIRGYDEPGEYTLLGTSAITLKDRPELLLKLLRYYMEYWIEMYPDRFISRIYAQAVSDSGDRLASSLFMAPRYDLAGPYPSYMLDLARPGRSKLINWFQDKLKTKAAEKGVEFPPEELLRPYTPSIQPVQLHVQVTPAQATHAPPQPSTLPDELPAGTVHIKDFLAAHNLKSHRRRIIGYLDTPAHKLAFRSFQKPNRPTETDRYLEPEQQEALLEWLHIHHPDVFSSQGDD